ncbi:MAG: carboxyl-terminal processing protease [Candidatus Midichloriaceae bacterium]|jgi:carboxyl-terminal processing protease|nr:carboxyl-terminal processing protease [Candidatus Midichloriaceae bacterium]
MNIINKFFVVLLLCVTNNALANSDAANTSQPSGVLNYYNLFVSKQDVNYELLFKEVMERTKVDYVDEVTDKKLIESAIEGMLSSLDPHSTFLNEKEFQEMRISTKGEFGGLGIEVTMEKGFIKVISPYEDGPAFKVGIRAGDFITMIDGTVVKGMTLSQAVEKLRGKPKTKVKLTIFRESTTESFEASPIREIVKIIPVKAKLVAENVALIKITTFNETTAALVRKEFLRLHDQAKEKGAALRGLILDLRWNPGGLFEQAKEIAELFLEDGVIVSTKGRLPESNQVYRASGIDITEGLPIAVLINGGSASASEIVAGALQENRRALLVGTKSFGKGSVQTVLPLPGNTAMKLTTSRYYTPSGKAIQANGIEPDVVVEEAIVTKVKQQNNIPNEAALLGHLAQEGESKNGAQPTKKIQSISNFLDVKELEDYQLLRAIDVVKGMALYSERLAS